MLLLAVNLHPFVQSALIHSPHAHRTRPAASRRLPHRVPRPFVCDAQLNTFGCYLMAAQLDAVARAVKNRCTTTRTIMFSFRIMSLLRLLSFKDKHRKLC